MPELPASASVVLPESMAEALRGDLRENSDIDFADAGAARGVVGDACELIVVATPSFAAVLMLLERLRRLRLPRTYVRLSDDGLDIWTDAETSDGRIVVIGDGHNVTELDDRSITAEDISRALGLSRSELDHR